MATDNQPHITWHAGSIQRQQREKLHGHPGGVVWFTGLSGSGKSTLAHAAEAALHQQSWSTYVLDGDNIRHGLNQDLGFSAAHRQENIRRIGEVAALMADAGLLVLVAFISPFRTHREAVRQRLPQGRFIETYLDCPLEVCAQRDPKGLYAKAQAGQIPEFTGISSPYEAPLKPELQLQPHEQSVAQQVAQLTAYLQQWRQHCWHPAGAVAKETP